MKKIIAVVITVIMLISVCGMQSFAFTVKLPTVTGVILVENEPVSLKALDKAKADSDAYLETFLEAHGITLEEIKAECEELFGSDFEDLFYTFYVSNAVFEITLSDGSVIEVDIDDGYYEIDDYTEIFVDAYITYDEYLSEKEEDDGVIDITVECEVYSYISGISKESDFTLELETVDCYVRNFEPVSAIDYSLYEDSDTLDLEGKRFSVTYADGSNKILTAEYDPAEQEFMLGDEMLSVRLEEDAATVIYMDTTYEHSVSYDEESPYESIEITDYDFNETEGLESVTYKITDKNGRSDTFTADMTPYLDGKLYPYFWNYVATYDTYYVRISCFSLVAEDSYETDAMELYASIGELYSESVEVDYVERDEEKDIFAVLEEVLANILTVFFNIINFFKN